MARPSIYTDEIANLVCERLMGGQSLRTICADEGMPGMTTVFRWLQSNDAFRKQYTLARQVQAEVMVDEIISISDDGSNDTYETENGPAVNTDVIARSRLRVDSRKWFASKLAPKIYGDRVSHEHAGPEGGPIQTITRTIVDPQAPA